MICISFQAVLIKQVTGIIHIIDISISAAVLIIVIFFIYILQRFTSHYFNHWFTRLALSVILIAKVVFIERFLGNRLIYENGYNALFHDTIIIRSFVAFLVISFFSIILWLIFYIRRAGEQANRKLNADNALRDAELIKLRQQIQPHFLFNSLNSINALVGTEPKQARKMIENLSDFLRGTLKKDENLPVLLKEEIDLLKLYLDIEKVRFGHRLNINFDINEQALNLKMPPLLLQPIVENAIKFGLYNVLNNVEIKIKTSLKDHLLEIVVSNPFDSESVSSKKGEGFGLPNIRRRLQLIYHRSDLLRTEKTDNLFTTVVLIPQS